LWGWAWLWALEEEDVDITIEVQRGVVRSAGRILIDDDCSPFTEVAFWEAFVDGRCDGVVVCGESVLRNGGSRIGRNWSDDWKAIVEALHGAATAVGGKGFVRDWVETADEISNVFCEDRLLEAPVLGQGTEPGPRVGLWQDKAWSWHGVGRKRRGLSVGGCP
jgi:hypothetical protein